MTIKRGSEKKRDGLRMKEVEEISKKKIVSSHVWLLKEKGSKRKNVCRKKEKNKTKLEVEGKEEKTSKRRD